MKKMKYLLALFILLLPALIEAGRQEGIMTEFRVAEDRIRSKVDTPEMRLRRLERNLVRAVKQAIERRYYEDREELTKGLTPEALAYESPTSELIYYVKYKSFIIRFDFPRDPELYDLAPTYEKFLVIEGGGTPAAQPSGGAKTGSGN